MEFLLVLPIAGLMLPPRYSLRLGGAGILALLAAPVYFNTSPGNGSDPFGMALLTAFVALFLGAIVLGIVLRWLWNSWHNIPMLPEDLAAPWADRALMAFAMVLPAGIAALWLGDALAGNTAPLRTHLLLLTGLAGMALVAALPMPGLIRAALLGFAAFLALIVADSMRLDRQMRGLLPQYNAYCMAIGPDRLPPDEVPPLMGLTAQKPILRVTQENFRLHTQRWSFRYHGFVRDGTGSATPPCTPAPP